MLQENRRIAAEAWPGFACCVSCASSGGGGRAHAALTRASAMLPPVARDAQQQINASFNESIASLQHLQMHSEASMGNRNVQCATELLGTLRHGDDAKARVVAANQLAELLEETEERFKMAVGDAPSRPAQRPHHPIGKLLLVIRNQSEAFGAAMQVGP